MAQVVRDADPKDLDALLAATCEGKSVLDVQNELVGKIGENIGGRRFARSSVDGTKRKLAQYIHMGSKIGVMVTFDDPASKLDMNTAREVAMHIAAMKPSWIGRDDVPEDTVAQEREIYASTDEVQSKPEQAREKIVEGMLNKRFFGANVLLDQEWIHDSGKKVGDALGQEGAEVLEFERFELSAG